MAELSSFKIIPILGRKVDVSADDISMFQFLGEGVALVHDAGGVNFDLVRKRNSLCKSYGYTQWSNTATGQATKCLGLFELYNGTNRDHLIFDNGKVYYYDAALDPADITAAGVTHLQNNVNLVKPIRVGNYVVWGDWDTGTTLYSWKNGDANAAKAISSGTEFKFRHLEYFMRRLIGFYSDQANGDIDVRWTDALPVPQTSLTFGTNQIFVANDDPINGVRKMGHDRCFIYCEDSINQIVYFPDYVAPFRIFTIVPNHGAVNNPCIVSVGDRHYFFNKNLGFCEYNGGRNIIPIGRDIESDMLDMNSQFYDLIVGTFVNLTNEIVWSVPMGGGTTPTHLLFYNIDTKQWRREDKAMRYVDSWQMFTNFTWNDLIAELSGTGATWSQAGTNTWAFYISERQRLSYANTDGQLYYQSTEGLAGAALDAEFITPVMDFGDPNRRDLISEIWVDFPETTDYDLHIYWRGGSTAGEVINGSWTELNPISADNPEYPICYCDQNDRKHQFRFRTDAADEKFVINGITFKFTREGPY